MIIALSYSISWGGYTADGAIHELLPILLAVLRNSPDPCC